LKANTPLWARNEFAVPPDNDGQQKKTKAQTQRRDKGMHDTNGGSILDSVLPVLPARCRS